MRPWAKAAKLRPSRFALAPANGLRAGGGPAAGGIALRAAGRQPGVAGAQTFAPGQLGTRPHEELFVGGQLADAEGAAVTGDPLGELVLGGGS